MSVVLLVIAFLSLCFFLLKRNYGYWKRRGVPGPDPTFFFGNTKESFLFKKSIGEVCAEIYKNHEKAPFIGIFATFSPCMLVCDPEIVRDVLVREFSSFHDNDVAMDVNIDPLFGRNPFGLKGEEWKKTRSQLTPCFSSGKIKAVYPLIESVSQNLVKYIATKQSTGPMEAKDLCQNFTIDSIASCAFGLEGKCFEEENSEFKKLATGFISPGSWNTLKIFLIMLIPALKNVLTIKFGSPEVEAKLIQIVSQTLEYRRANGITRNDFLDILQQVKEKDKTFTDIDVTAHAAGFITDGSETSAVAMSFLIYNLASNREAQNMLRAEIETAVAKNGGKLPYEELQSLPYLDACLNESLRIHPAASTQRKVSTKTWNYVPKRGEGFTKSPVRIETGTPIIIPIHALHMDPKYYTDPEKYIPERFLSENADKLVKYTFLPFGEGPRACLGQRFGIIQMKVGIAHLIKNYRFSVNPKTQEPLKYDPVYFMLSAIGGLWINFEKI